MACALARAAWSSLPARRYVKIAPISAVEWVSGLGSRASSAIISSVAAQARSKSLAREGRVGQRRQGCAAKLEVFQPFGDRQGRARGGFVALIHCLRGQRVPPDEGAVLAELQGLLDPAVDERPVWLLDPHPRSLHRLQGEVGVHLR